MSPAGRLMNELAAFARKGFAMLVMSRKKNESIVINNDITITVVDIRDDKVRLGIVAPRDVPVHRQEVYDALHGRDVYPHEPVAREEEISKMIIVEAKLQQGGSVHFTPEGGFSVE